MNILNEIPSHLARHIPIKAALLQAGIAKSASSLCDNLGKTLLICDENTQNFVKLKGDNIILPARQKPEFVKAQELAKHSPDYFIAVGSGSLNDMVKYAAFLADKPYIVFATAPSMNGYASANVSLLVDGYKKSFLARPPEYIYLDSEILANAPRRLINSGIGDAICRGTAQCDAVLSAEVKATPDYSELFSLLKTHEEEIFDDIEALTKTLIFGGIAMLLGKSSAPASQGEHMLAHYMELMQPDMPQSFHGEQIAVTTVTMAKLQAKLMEGVENYSIPPINEGEMRSHFGNKFAEYCLLQTQAKYSDANGKPNRKELEKYLVNGEAVAAKLKSLGAPSKPSDIGWDENIYTNALKFTRYTRDRFTFLDLNY